MSGQAPPIYRRPKWLVDYQLRAMFGPERYSWIEATTKAGKTAGCLAWLIEQAVIHGKLGREFWWVAPVNAQAKIAFRRARNGLPRELFRYNRSEQTITLINGARIVFKSGEKPDNLFGEDVFACVIDEASRLREGSWHAVRSTLTATQAPLRIIGNVKGRKNWFYKGARRAEAEADDPDSNQLYSKITAKDAVDAGIISGEEVEDARKMLPKAVFDELYRAIPTEDGSNPFGFPEIRACSFDDDEDGLEGISAVKAFGVDLAKSIDYTVLIGLDADGKVAYFDRYQKPWKDTVEDILETVGDKFCLVDSTGVGDAVLEQLQQGRSNFEGYVFTGPSKQQLMESLRLGIHQRRISFPIGTIVNELESFEYEYTRTGVRYSAPEGEHDDCVMSLALAGVALKNADARTWGEVDFRIV